MVARRAFVFLFLFICLSFHLAHAGNASRHVKKKDTPRAQSAVDAGIDAGVGEIELVPLGKRRVVTSEPVTHFLPPVGEHTHTHTDTPPAMVIVTDEVPKSEPLKMGTSGHTHSESGMESLKASSGEIPPAEVPISSEKSASSSRRPRMSSACKSFFSRLRFMTSPLGRKVLPRMQITEEGGGGRKKKPKFNLNRVFVKVTLETPMVTVSGSTLHRIPFYRSSGENSDERDTWFPFNGAVNAVLPGKICGYFDKKMTNKVDFSSKVMYADVTHPLSYQMRWLNYELSSGEMATRYPLPKSNPEDEDDKEAINAFQILQRDKHVLELLMHRWGNLQFMKISAMFGGGIWDKGTGRALKKLFNLRRACSSLGDFVGENDIFTALSIGVTDVTFEEANDWIGCDNIYGLHHATVASFDYNVRFREYFEHATGSPVNRVLPNAMERIDAIDDQVARYYVKPCTPERNSHLRITLPFSGSLDAIGIMLRKVQECERSHEELPEEMQYAAEQQLLRIRNQLQCKSGPFKATGSQDDAGSTPSLRVSSDEPPVES
eukprot:GILJ01001163.1.p1 GENE.GILJ01001163.1~~GILJ01001163.1.p1  ORF type:complete len:548 (+),score=67.60 GILJ01001163.1:43-1686(+)